MKNVRSITLGGIVFALEEDAYQALAAYLSRVEARLAGSADLEEIRGDIEGAIGEKLVARKRSEKQAATLADIEAIEHEMGGPDAYSEGEASDTVPEFDTADRKGSETRRRLYRDTDDAIVAGVASGIAQYFDIDPVIVRVLFVLSIFLNGFGVIAYLVLWLVVPAAHTTTEKYAMRGERVTLRDITERVKKNLEEHDVNAERARGVWARVRRILVLFFDALGAIVRGLGSIVRVAAGLILLFGGALALAALAASATFVLLADRTRFPEDVQVLLDATTAGTAGIVALIAGFILALVTLQFFILAGSSLLARRNHLTSRKVAGLAVLWIVSCAVAATAGALQAQDVVHELESLRGESGDMRMHMYWVPLNAEGEGGWQQITGEVLPDIEDTDTFAQALEAEVRAQLGQPIEGYEPAMFLQVLPGLEERDFDNVEAQIGGYEYKNDMLVYDSGEVAVIHSAAQAITETGMGTLYVNVRERLDLGEDATTREVLAELR